MGHQAMRPRARRMLKVSNVPLQAAKENLRALIDQYAPCEGLVIPSDGGGKVGSVYKVMMASDDDAEKVVP